MKIRELFYPVLFLIIEAGFLIFSLVYGIWSLFDLVLLLLVIINVFRIRSIICTNVKKHDADSHPKPTDAQIKIAPNEEGSLQEHNLSKLDCKEPSEYEQMRDMHIPHGDTQTRKMIDSPYQKQYESAVRTVRDGTDLNSMKQAAAALEQMGGYEDSSAMAQAARLRIQQIQTDAAAAALAAEKTEQLRKKKRTRVICGLVAGAISTFVLAVGINILVISPGHLRAGDEALAEGAYEEALNQYEKATRFGVNTQQAVEGQRKARIGLAEQMMTEGNPERAAELYHILGDSERENDAKTAWAKQKFEDGDFESALDLYESLGVTEQIDAVYFAWSESLLAEGDYITAIEKLNMASESSERTERLEALWTKRADEAVETVLAHDASGNVDLEFAAETGAELTALSAQLQFCRGLADAGYNLLEVYPDGVSIEDVVLDEYLPWSFGDNDEVDFSRVLLFERQEIPNGEYSYQHPTSEVSSPTDALLDLLGEGDSDSLEGQPDPTYNIRLLPGQLFGSGVDVADSWDDATCVILVDGAYVKAGEIEHVVSRENVSGRTVGIQSQTYYPYYVAFNNIAVYNKDIPKNGTVYDYSMTNPICYDDTWFNENKEQGNTVLAAENRFAEFDLAPLYDELEDAMLLMYLYYDL